MSQSEDSTNGDTREGTNSAESSAGEPPIDEGAAEWFAASTFRIGLAILGLVLLLIGLGRAVGVNLLQLMVDALNTRIGRWLAVALFGLLLISVALRGFGTRPR